MQNSDFDVVLYLLYLLEIMTELLYSVVHCQSMAIWMASWLLKKTYCTCDMRICFCAYRYNRRSALTPRLEQGEGFPENFCQRRTGIDVSDYYIAWNGKLMMLSACISICRAEYCTHVLRVFLLKAPLLLAMMKESVSAMKGTSKATSEDKSHQASVFDPHTVDRYIARRSYMNI